MPYRTRRLFHRLAIVVGTLIVLAIALPSVLTIRSQQRLLLTKLEDGAAATARIAALAAADPLAVGDVDTLSRLVATIAHESPDVARALVTDRSGIVLADSELGGEGVRIANLATPPAALVVRTVGDGALLEVTAPIAASGESLGALRLALPLAPTHAEMWHGTTRVVLTGLLVLVLGAFGAARVAASVARPVERLAEVAAEVGRGNLDVRSDYHAADELGALARRFDHMIQALADASAQLRGHSAALEEKVAARTEELSHAMVTAEAAGQVKSEFLASMSHEIRTPLHGIFGMTELALDSDDRDEQRYFIGRARACAESLLTIVNDVLDFSRIEAGKLELEDIDFDVRDVVAGVLDTLAIEANRKGLELIGFVDAALPARVRGDPGRLRQILLNLANNAVKFTETGEVVIRVDERPRGGAADASGDVDADEDVVVRVVVEDTGIGIVPEKQRVIFEAFTQADNSDARRFGGTGLGLAIARRLVALMDGTIDVESVTGRGSTFRAHVRLQRGDHATEARVPTVIDGLRILVVDDNSTNRAILLKMLQGWGCRVALAGGGLEACDLVAHAAQIGEPFDVVLMDMQMPDLNGVATGRRIRRDPASAELPLILLTSISRTLPREAGDVHFAATLPKPIKQAELRDAIVNAVGKRTGIAGSAFSA